MIVYLAHPLGADVDRNAARAVRWLAWLMEREPEHTVIAPWLPFVDVFRLRADARGSDTGHPFRERCMRDNLAAVKRCDGVVLCGGRISPGMMQEAEAVLVNVDLDGGVWDLTHLGDEPPADLLASISPLDVLKPWTNRREFPWIEREVWP